MYVRPNISTANFLSARACMLYGLSYETDVSETKDGEWQIRGECERR